MNQYFHGLTGEVVVPGDPSYNGDRQEWNRAIQRYPLAIVYCFCPYDVSNAIRWARNKSIPIRIRSGGHNYEGFSTGNGVLVIDVSRMSAMAIHDGLLTIEGGVNNSQVYEYVSSKGYPFPGGTCPTVALNGYALGGGWGLSCRLMGLGCDNLVELKLINYKGELLTANEWRNEDLFWACRGAGGGNFGVVVSMTFRLPPPIEKVTYAEVYYPNTSQRKQAQFLDTWQEWLRHADERITLIASIYRTPEEGFAVWTRGIFYGEPQEAEEILRPFTDIGGCEMNLEYVSFLEATKIVGSVYPPSQQFKSAGRFVVRPLTAEEIYRVVGLIRKIPEGSEYSAITVYALGGQVARTDWRDTAFFYRDAGYIIGIQSVWMDPQYARDNILWVSKRYRFLKTVTDGSYINFPFNGLLDYEEAYFGLNAKPLQMVKEKYDPYHVFNFPQAIR